MVARDWTAVARKVIDGANSTPALRYRQGEVVEINADGSIDITVAGDPTVVTDVPVADGVCPLPGSGIWLATDGADMFGVATIHNGPASCLVRRTTGQSITNDTATNLIFETDDEDRWLMWSGADSIVVQVPGLYIVTAAVDWAGNATGYRSLSLVKTLDVTAEVFAGSRCATIGGSTNTRQSASGIVRCERGSYITAQVRHTAGTSINVGGAYPYQASLRVVWLGK